jgi:FkbM family methyltransferase
MKFRDFVKLVISPAQLKARRELERVRKQPRYTPGTTTLFGQPLDYVDSSSYFFLHEEIFKEEVYAFNTPNPRPRIIDGGANIGLSVIYFKRRFPNAWITAFEADPAVAQVLKRNLEAHGIDDVEVRAEALWSHDGEIDFQTEGADGGRITSPNRAVAKVPTVALNHQLDEPIDFLKLDIEGAEFEVLKNCCGRLGNVDKAFIEYHSSSDQPQMLPELLAIIKNAGFRCYVTTPSVFSQQPFLEVNTYNGFDMVVNIHACRQ